MMTHEIHPYEEVTPAAAEASAKAVWNKHRQKELRNALISLQEDIFRDIEEGSGDYLSEAATDRAIAFIDRVLKGDDAAARSLFECRYGSRYKQGHHDNGEPWARLIHGSIFITSAVDLRAKLVEVHAELLKNERILDLESIVDGLTRQLRKTEIDLERTRARL